MTSFSLDHLFFNFFFFLKKGQFNSLMKAIHSKKCQQDELRSICPDIFNCGNGVKIRSLN